MDAAAERDSLSDLVDAARGGDERAWDALVARLTPMMRVIAHHHRLCEADAADVVQSSWVKCFENLGRIRITACLPGWLATTCRREALRVVRERQRCVPVPEEHLLDGGAPWPGRPAEAPDPVDVMLQDEVHTMLRHHIGELPERQRHLVTAILHSHDATQRYEQLADTLAMPVGSIGPTRRRAVHRLRRSMELEGVTAA
jgi:RNA polymerase sigma factor (sigma-70 family)